MKRTSIISVNYNQTEVTIAFLKSVKENTVNNNVEVIIVDNSPLTDQETVFKAHYEDIVYIRSRNNLGFAGGNNLGINVATGDFILLLNNDTEITPNLLDVLCGALEDNKEIGLISPLILYYDNPETIQYAGFTEMNYLTARNSGIGSMEKDIGQYDLNSAQTAFCHGAAMMCRREDLKVVGLMEENYFLYYEEMDWCEKFRRCGKKMWFTGQAKVYHKESISVGKESSIKTYFMTRNRMLFIRRNTNTLNTFCFSVFFIVLACSKQAWVYYRKGRKDLIKWIIKGVLWNLSHSKNSKILGFKI